MKWFKDVYEYEHISQDNILHMRPVVHLKSSNDVETLWKNFEELLKKFSKPWLVVNIDNFDFSFGGVDAFFARFDNLQDKISGSPVRYTSGRQRLDKRFSFLSGAARAKIKANLFPSREKAFEEIYQQIKEGQTS